MSVDFYGIIGAGGFGREVFPAVRTQLVSHLEARTSALVFVSEAAAVSESRNGADVVSLETFLNYPGNRRFAIAIADSTARARIARICERAGAVPFDIKAQSTVVLDGSKIGEGAILCDFSMITSNAHIGRHFHANIYSYVAHDCIIGDFVTFAPAVKCNGNIRIHDHAYLGTGAIIRPGKRGKPLVIGERAIVGMGAIVTRDVPPGATVVGNPARVLRSV